MPSVQTDVFVDLHDRINLLGGLGQKFALGLSITTQLSDHTYHHLCFLYLEFRFNTFHKADYRGQLYLDPVPSWLEKYLSQ